MVGISLLTVPLLGILAIAWLVSVASAWELLTKHRPEGRAISDYMDGSAWFGADAFTPSGASARKRMHAGLAVFFLIAFGVAAVVIASEFLGA